MMATPPPSPLLSIRAALILLIAIVVGLVAGTLNYLANGGIAAAVLIGGSAAGGALALFNALLDHR
ncbi:MAG: hypothetical protein ACRDRO_03725 [Pseudonocardiaceae bacterium]